MAQMLVTHVDASGPYLRVFGQLNSSHMEIVQTNIDSVIKHYDKNSPTVPLQVGTLCFAKRFNKFCRARVIFLQTPEFVTVHFLDYGDDRKVGLSEIRLLRYPKLLENFPKQVSSFILSGIYNDWKPKQLEEINNEICNQMVEVHIQLEVGDYIFVRILWLMKDYSEYLIQRKFGVSISLEKLIESYASPFEGVKPINNNNIKRTSRGIMPGRQIHPGIAFNPELMNPFVTPPPPIMQPVMQQRAIIPNLKVYSNTGVYNPALSAALGLSPKTFRKPYVPPQAQNYAGPPVPATAVASPKRSVATFKSNTLMVGSFYDVYCCFVENGPCLFSVHLKAMENDLNTMMTQLESVPLRNLTERPSLGMACIARFSEDGQLYRAVIMNIKPTACQVAYVDYGNTELVSFTDLYEIPSNFLEQKIFAIRFSLSGYKELEPIDETIKLFFKDIALHKNLTLKVMPLEGPPLVQYCELYDGQTNILETLQSHRNRKLTYDNPQNLHSDEMVIICYVESPKKFFVQKVSNKEAFDKMMDDLYIYCATCKTTPNAYTVGTACAVKFETAWYRAEITGESGSRVIIRHVDFGNERQVDPEHLYALTERLVRFPPQAIQCCLKGFENTATLSDTAATQLEMLAESDYGERRHFKCQIFKIERNGVALVNLIDEQLRPELNLMKKLYKLSMPFNKYIGLEKEGFEQPPDQAKFSNSSKISSPPVVDSQVILNSTSVNGENTANNASSDWEGGSSGSADNRDQRSNSGDNRRQNSGSRPFRENNNNRRSEQSYSTFKGKNVPPRFQKQTENNRRYKENRFDNNTDNNSYERPKSSSFESSSTRYNQSQRSSYQSTSMHDDEDWNENDSSVKTSATSEEYVSSSFNFLRDSLNVPKREEVIICWWISPHQFYTHLKSQTLKFEQMMKQMQTFYKNKAAIKEVLSVGSSVIARYREDNVLYRAKIIACNQSLKKYKVEFVDFGNQSTVGQDDIYEIEKRFSEHPAMANLCSFEDVVSNYDHRYITTQVEKYLQSGSTIMCDYVSKENETYFVNIEINGESLRDILVNEGILSVVDKGMKLELLIGQQIKAKIVQIKDLLNFQIEIESCNIKLMCCYNDIKFIKSNPHLSLEFQRDYEGQICVADVLDVTGEKILMLQPHIPLFNNQIAMRICEYPIIYQTFNIKVSFVQTANKVFIHPVTIEDSLAQMLDDMYNYYDGNGKELTNIRTGELCTVNSSDGNWYRARIMTTLSNETTEVYYLDYGNTEIIDSQDKLKQLENEFCETSALAIKIYLPLKSIRTDDEETVIQEIKSLTAGYELTLHILERYKSSWIVDLSSDGYSLLQLLEDKGMIQGRDINYIKNLIDNEASIVPIIDLTTEPDSSYYSDSNKQDYATGDDSASDTCQKWESKNLIPAYLSHCDNPGRFFLHLTEGFEDLSKLQDNIQIVAGSLPPLMSIVTGAPCIALYSVDDTWYRAKIIDNEIMAVQFIDYGNTDVVTDSSYIKEMNEAFGKIKPFAIPCSLPIAPKNTVDWIDEANIIFNESYEKTVYFDYITKGEKKNYINFFIDKQNIADKFVNDGIAKRLEIVKSGQNCFISHINSLKDFYIQMESDAAALELIAGHLSGFEDFPPVKEYEEGHICAALFPDDGGWYRAKILSKCDDGTTEVLFIDYGNTAMSTELREISNEIANLPFLSKKCSLRCPDNILIWSDAAETKFNELSAMGQTVFVVQLIEPGENVIVDLYCGENNILNELEPLCNKRSASFDLNLDSSTDTVKAISNENEFDLTDASISHINSPTDFYIQFTEHIDELTNLTTSLNDAQMESLDNPDVGSICAAIYPDDGTFYRAKVLSTEDNSYKVCFIDYGNETISTEIRILPDNLKDLPTMAKKCSLENPLNIDLSSDLATEKFNLIMEPIIFEKMKVKITNQINEPWTVRMFCNDMNINKELFKALGESEMDNNKLEVICTEEEINEHLTSELNTVKAISNENEFDSTDVSISHINSPTDFYIQFTEKIDELTNLTTSLNDAQMESFDNPEVGSICAAIYPDDGTFYRAKVLSAEDNNYKVCFIDYGNETISTEIRILPDNLKDLPTMAKKCSIENPLNIDLSSDLATEKFNLIMEPIMFEKMKVKITNQINEPWTVRMFCNDMNINKELFKALGEYEMDNNKLGVICTEEEINEHLTSELNTVKAISNVNEFDLTDASISHINSPTDFYIQFTEKIDELANLTTSLNDAQMESFDNPEVGSICAAIYPDDGTFYRAKVLSAEDNNYKVRFIDYGNETISTEIRILSDNLKDLPTMAKQCSLENPLNIDFSSDLAIEKFNSIMEPIMFEKMKVEVTNQINEPWTVRMFCNDMNINEELFKALGESEMDNNELEVICTEEDEHLTSELEGVLITHVVSPNEFYIQLQSKCSESKTITEYLSNAASFMKLTKVNPNMLCATLSPEDGAYYRGKVLSVDDSINDILFIDFGMTSNSNDLRVLPSELEAIDPIAIKCCLNKITEIDFNDKVVIECFTKLMESHLGEPFKAMIINKTKFLWTIELFVQGRSISLELKKLIQDYGKVKPSSTTSYTYKKVTLSHVNSPNDFYIQLSEDKVILDKITEKIINNNIIENISEPIENEIYAAKFPDDGAFYRAKILSSPNDDYYEVIFIDFGNTAYTNEFHNLPNEIKNIDHVAKHCALENLTEYDFWSQTAADNFCSLLNPHLTETFHIEVIENSSDPWIIKLYLQNKNITEELITILNDNNYVNQTEIWDSTKHTSSEQISKEILNDIIDNCHSESSDQIDQPKVAADSLLDLLNEVVDNLSLNTSSSSQEVVTAEQASNHNSNANLSADSTIYELAIETTSHVSSEADLQKQLNNRAVSTSVISCKPSSLAGSNSYLQKSQNENTRSKSVDHLNTKD